MVLSYAFCNVSVLPLKKEPSHRSEQVSQLLFGEKAEVLELNETQWARIRCLWDDYEGWCKMSQLTIISKKEFYKEQKFIATRNTDKLLGDDVAVWLPAGSDIAKSSIILHHHTFTFKGKKAAVKQLSCNGEHLKHAAMQFLDAPYMWGGRTIAGIDCSGLTQMAYKLCNKKLSRDASQQAREGYNVDFLQHAQCGDLAFFDNEEGYITHVGMLLNPDTIIHATEVAGRVVIDKIDPAGIISKTLKKRTHNLRMVKRLMD